MSKFSQIIAMGGGGFSMEPENLLLDRYVLAASGVQVPKVCFLPTASGDSDWYIDRYHSIFSGIAMCPDPPVPF